jgi:hypothetical protein
VIVVTPAEDKRMKMGGDDDDEDDEDDWDMQMDDGFDDHDLDMDDDDSLYSRFKANRKPAPPAQLTSLRVTKNVLVGMRLRIEEFEEKAQKAILEFEGQAADLSLETLQELCHEMVLPMLFNVLLMCLMSLAMAGGTAAAQGADGLDMDDSDEDGEDSDDDEGSLWDEEEAKHMVELANEGLSFAQIAERLGRTEVSCRNRYNQWLNHPDQVRERAGAVANSDATHIAMALHALLLIPDCIGSVDQIAELIRIQFPNQIDQSRVPGTLIPVWRNNVASVLNKYPALFSKLADESKKSTVYKLTQEVVREFPPGVCACCVCWLGSANTVAALLL